MSLDHNVTISGKQSATPSVNVPFSSPSRALTNIHFVGVNTLEAMAPMVFRSHHALLLTVGVVAILIDCVQSATCVDDPEDWRGRGGNTCSWFGGGYFTNRCKSFGDLYEYQGKAAIEACCICGGGKTVEQKPPSPTPVQPRSPSMDCVNDPKDWEGRAGLDCDWYTDNQDRCRSHGDMYVSMGKTANEACCGCGGGIMVPKGAGALISSPRPTTRPTPQPSPLPSFKPTRQTTPNPTRRPTPRPSPLPTANPTSSPTATPTQKPTIQPTTSPTIKPTTRPTQWPTPYPTRRPTPQPTPFPTPIPTPSPTVPSTREPSIELTRPPTAKPTSLPTHRPTPKPSPVPTPTASPTVPPTREPTIEATAPPTAKQTSPPTRRLTPKPSPAPIPTTSPTVTMTLDPTIEPTAPPTPKQTSVPTRRPTPQPSPLSTPNPSKRPTPQPTPSPSPRPTDQAAPYPTISPTLSPTLSKVGGKLEGESPTSTPTPSPTPTPARTEKDANVTVSTEALGNSLGTGKACSENKQCKSKTCRSGVCMASSECYPVKHKRGRPFDKNAINIVFVGSSFNATSQQAWRSQVKRTYRHFSNFNMFSEGVEQLNVFRVDPVEPSSSFCWYGCVGVDRLLCCDTEAAERLSSRCFTVGANLQTVVIHNDRKYGGAGFNEQNIATMSTHSQGHYVAIHELGHSLFELSDEYSYSIRTTEGPNCAASSDCSKWSDLIENTPLGYSQVSCIPGCYNNSYYIGGPSYMQVLDESVGAVNERFTCCTYQALTKSMPSYCDVFNFSPNYLFEYCQSNDFQQYGAYSYDEKAAVQVAANTIPGNARGDNAKYIYVTNPFLVKIKLRKNGRAVVKGKPVPLPAGMYHRYQVRGHFTNAKDAEKHGLDSYLKVRVFYRTGKEVLFFSQNKTIEVPLLFGDDSTIEENVPRTVSQKSKSVEVILDSRGRRVKKVRALSIKSENAIKPSRNL